MCKFFSFNSNGQEKFYYFDWKIRQEIISGKLDYEIESHTSVADYFGFIGTLEDKLNKYEYNPLTKEFVADQINATNDKVAAEKWVRRLNFSKIVEPLIIKPIIHPFKIKPQEVTKKEIELLKKWASVWDSVEDSIRASVRDSVGDSVWESARASVWASVWASVSDSVGNSVRDSVWAAVCESVKASVWAYTGSFIKKHSFKSCIKLWEKGFVPSFDGKIWRLHTKAEIVFEISKELLLQ